MGPATTDTQHRQGRGASFNVRLTGTLRSNLKTSGGGFDSNLRVLDPVWPSPGSALLPLRGAAEARGPRYHGLTSLSTLPCREAPRRGVESATGRVKNAGAWVGPAAKGEEDTAGPFPEASVRFDFKRLPEAVPLTTEVPLSIIVKRDEAGRTQEPLNKPLNKASGQSEAFG